MHKGEGLIYIPLELKDLNFNEFWEVNGCVDTASNQTAISLELADFLSLEKRQTSITCLAIKNMQVKADYEAIIKICLKDYVFDMNVIIIEDFQDELILGSDFLEIAKAQIDYKTETFKIQTTDQTHKRNKRMKKILFKTKETVTIPANSYKIIDIYCNDDLENITEIEPSSKLARHGLLASNTLFFPNDNNSHKILIANQNSFDDTIFKGQNIGQKSDDSDYNFYIKPTYDLKIKKIRKCVKILKNTMVIQPQNVNKILNRRQQVEEKIKALNDKNKHLSNDTQISHNINENLTQGQKNDLLNILNKYENQFSKHSLDLGYCDIYKHKIITEDKIVNIPNYRLSTVEKEYIRKQVQDLADAGIVVESTSPYNSPVLLCPKPDGVRLVLDFRNLNSITQTDFFPIPPVKNVLSALGGSKYFAKIDLTNGFFQIALDKESQAKTAFSTDIGHYQFTRLAQGLKNSPSCFSRTINTIMADLEYKIVISYVDDCIVFAKTFEEFLRRLKIVLERLKKYNLKLKPSKCEFGMSEITFLGFKINEKGISIDERKIEAILKMPEPQNIKELQSFLGHINFNRDHIKDCSLIAQPLYHLLSKGVKFEFGDKQREAFNKLKNALVQAPILSHFNENYKTILKTDASNYGVGAALCQKDDQGNEYVIGYISKTLSGHQKNWIISEKEFFAVYFALVEFRPYLIGRKFTIITDHKSISGIRNTTKVNSRLFRWVQYLSDFDFDIEYRTPKHTTQPDNLSRLPIPNTITEFDQDEIGFKVFKCRKFEKINMSLEQRNDPEINDVIVKIGTG